MAQDYLDSPIPARSLRRAPQIRGTLRIAPALPLAIVLIAAALALAAALRAPPPRTLDVGAAGDSRFVSEMLENERDPATGITFRWTEPFARLWLHGTEFDPFALSLHIYNHEALAGRRDLALDRGGQPLGALRLGEGWRVYRVLLPGAADGAALALATDPIHVPGDSQERGVPLDWARLDPLARAGVPRRALLLAWGLAALAGWLWLLDRALLRTTAEAASFVLRPSYRVWRVSLLVVSAAAALALWARAAPYALARDLPPMPWAFGVATALLAAIALRPLRARPLPRPATLGLVALLVAAQVLLTTHAAIGLAVGLALLSLAILPLGAQPAADGERHGVPAITARENQLSRRAEILALAVVLLAALGLRFYRLADLPYGLWRDEGRHGLEALQMLADPSYRPAYIPGGVDLPGLGLRPFALALWAWGIRVWSMRTITALAGALAVLPLFALVRRLYGSASLALLASGLLAVSSWSVTISRFSFPTIFDPLLQLTALWLIMVGLDRQPATAGARFRFWTALFLAGLCLGLAAQTYHTGRLGPIVAGGLALLLLLRAPRRWRAWLLGMATVSVGFVLAVSPLLGYALSNPSAFNQRVGAVFLLREESGDKRGPLAKLDESVGRHLLMFNVRGDANGRHAAPDHPMLDAVSGLGLLAGTAALLRRRRDWRSLFLLAALVVGLVPSLLAVDSPHAMRSIDALPFACVVAAIGLAQLWRIVSRGAAPSNGQARDKLGTADDRRKAKALSVARRPSPVVVAALVWALALALNAWTYFAIMPADREVWTAFYPLHTKIGAYVRALADAQGPEATRQVYVSDRLVSNPVFGYLTYGLPVQTFNSRRLSAPARAGALFVVTGSTSQHDLAALIAQNGLDPAPLTVGPPLPDGSIPAFVVYRKN